MKINKFASIAAIFAFLAAISATALEVNEDEIRVTDEIRFENYTGPHAVIETAEAITEIGRGLGRQVARNPEAPGSFGLNGKYSVIHAIDPNEAKKFDADIILINSNATVDHIRNLRRIIAGYLSTAYGYNNSDATTIATFVTVYNAVYRQNLDVFQARYKDVVTKNLTKEKCGLSTKWSDWAGNSQIVIPLYDVNGGLSTVDTSVISDRTVVEKMREDNDKGVDVRQDMVDIKEREAEAASDKAQDAAEKAAQEKQKLAEQKNQQKQAEKAADSAKKNADQAGNTAKQADTKAQNAQKQADNAQKNAEQAQKKAEENPDDKAAQDAAKKAQEDAKKAQEDALKAQQEALAKQQEAIKAQEAAQKAQENAEKEAENTQEQAQKTSEAEAEAEKHQAFADKKETEAQADRTEIAKDKQALLEEALAVDEANAIIGLKVVNESKDLSQMVKVSAADGSTIKVSPVNVVHERIIMPVVDPVIEDATSSSVQTSSVYYVAICGDGSASSNNAVKLCLLDSGNMEIQKESNEFVANDSVLVTDGNGGYYCVIQDGGNYVVAKYNKSLQVQVKSNVAVESNTPIVLSPKGVVVVSKGGNIVLLDTATLTSKF